MTGLDFLKDIAQKKADELAKEKATESASKPKFNFSVGIKAPLKLPPTEKEVVKESDGSVATSAGDSTRITPKSEQKTEVDLHVSTSLPGESPAANSPLDLKPEVAERMKMFTDSLDTLRAAFDDVELMPQIVRQIMLDMQETPEFLEMLSDKDINLMMDSFYKTMAIARASKEKKKVSKKKTVSTKGAEANALLDDMGFGEMLSGLK